MFTVGKNVRITIATGHPGGNPTYIFPALDDKRVDKALRKFNETRISMSRRGRMPEDRSYEARIEMFDEICLGVENSGAIVGTYGENDPEVQSGEAEVGDDKVLPLQEAYPTDWKDHVIGSHKTSCCSYFEEKGILTEEDRGN